MTSHRCLSGTSPRALSVTSLRASILLTMSHVEHTYERKNLLIDQLIVRIRETFVCKSIVVSQERHISRGGLHYHYGIWNETASKHTAASRLRENLFFGCVRWHFRRSSEFSPYVRCRQRKKEIEKQIPLFCFVLHFLVQKC